jgi:hypothetical protein
MTRQAISHQPAHVIIDLLSEFLRRRRYPCTRRHRTGLSTTATLALAASGIVETVLKLCEPTHLEFGRFHSAEVAVRTLAAQTEADS